jgi:hypothetical protein
MAPPTGSEPRTSRISLDGAGAAKKHSGVFPTGGKLPFERQAPTHAGAWPEVGRRLSLGGSLLPRHGEAIALSPSKEIPRAPPPVSYAAAFKERPYEAFNLLLEMAETRK